MGQDGFAGGVAADESNVSVGQFGPVGFLVPANDSEYKFNNREVKPSYTMAYTASSVQDVKNILAGDSQFQAEFKQDPQEAIRKIEDTSTLPDTWVYRMVVGSLGLVILVIAIGIVWRVASGATIEDKNVPTILTALGSAAVGALAGLLAPSPARK